MRKTSKNVVGTRQASLWASLRPGKIARKQNLFIIYTAACCLTKICSTAAHRQEEAHCCQCPSFTLHRLTVRRQHIAASAPRSPSTSSPSGGSTLLPEHLAHPPPAHRQEAAHCCQSPSLTLHWLTVRRQHIAARAPRSPSTGRTLNRCPKSRRGTVPNSPAASHLL